jgi:hypothetical protein
MVSLNGRGGSNYDQSYEEIARFFIRLTYETDPLSLPEGEASQGEHPLTPLHYISCFIGNFLGFQFNFLKARCMVMNARDGLSNS